MKPDQPRAGRPTTAGIEGQKSTLSIRASAELKARLDTAAKERGRSLSQEAEIRLEQSFRDDRPLLAAFEASYGRELGGLLLVVGDAMRAVSEYKPYAFAGFTPAWTFYQMVKAANAVFRRLATPGSRRLPDPLGIAASRLSGQQKSALSLHFAQTAELERHLGLHLASRRLDRLADETRPDAARDLMGAELASRAALHRP